MPDSAAPTIDADTLLSLLRAEVAPATGCTEIAAVALAAARAVELLGEAPDLLLVTASAPLLRNAALAGVPGIDRRGTPAAAALGAAIADSSAGLTLLDGATEAHRAAARALLDQDAVGVQRQDGVPPLHLLVRAERGGRNAAALIAGRHDAFAALFRDGVALPLAAEEDGADPLDALRSVSLRQMLRVVRAMPSEAFDFLLAAAEVNAHAAEAARERSGPLAAALSREAARGPSPRRAARFLAGAASEGRMTGMPVAVAAICGSGNHGIANFLGVLGVARHLAADRATLARALAIASTVTLAVKAHTGRLGASCGCAIAPATGVAAATAFLYGGGAAAQEHAMQGVVATFSGLICDGAKASCAFKVAAVVGAAVELGMLAATDAHVADGEGILGNDIDRSLDNLARLDRQGMRGAENLILDLIGA